MKKIRNKIKDSLGFIWFWDGRRVYMPECDEIFALEGLDPEENGYPANTFEEAINVLKDGGYLDEQ